MILTPSPAVGSRHSCSHPLFPCVAGAGDSPGDFGDLLAGSRSGGGFGGGIFDLYILVVPVAAHRPHRSSGDAYVGALPLEAAQWAARGAARSRGCATRMCAA